MARTHAQRGFLYRFPQSLRCGDGAIEFQSERAILELGDKFYDPVAPADFPKTILRYRDDVAAATIGLEGLSDTDWISHFGRFRPMEGSLLEPLALRYHGHQFRSYNPDLGDGRGFLFAQGYGVSPRQAFTDSSVGVRQTPSTSRTPRSNFHH